MLFAILNCENVSNFHKHKVKENKQNNDVIQEI